MDPKFIWLTIGVAVGVAAVLGAVSFWRTRRTSQLRQRFGPEYDHTVQEKGDIRRAEADLEERAKRVQRLHIRPLTKEEADVFLSDWRLVQAQFVDDPRGATSEANTIVSEVMRTRGYPVVDFEQRVDDISVDHPNVVMNFRAARDIAQEYSLGRATTEDLRQAMVHYRALFDELVSSAAERHEADQPLEATRSRR